MRIGPNIQGPIVQTYVESPTVTDLVKIDSYGGDRIGAILLSPYIKPGTVSDISYNHYSLLRSLEDIYGSKHWDHLSAQRIKGYSPDEIKGVNLALHLWGHLPAGGVDDPDRGRSELPTMNCEQRGCPCPG